MLDAGRTSLARGASLSLGPRTTLGRSDRNAIVLDDAFVSGEHASISREDGRLLLTDHGSTNGTIVNEKPVQGQVPLGPGDVIRIGEIRLRVGS